MLASSLFEIEHKIYTSLKSFPPTIVKWFMYVIFLMHVILDEVKTFLNFVFHLQYFIKNRNKKSGNEVSSMGFHLSKEGKKLCKLLNLYIWFQ
jgi:hypothetical protein